MCSRRSLVRPTACCTFQPSSVLVSSLFLISLPNYQFLLFLILLLSLFLLFPLHFFHIEIVILIPWITSGLPGLPLELPLVSQTKRATKMKEREKKKEETIVFGIEVIERKEEKGIERKEESRIDL